MSATHDEEAKVRDAEVARLHPDLERRHLRATLPARVVLRDIEKHEGGREIKLLGESYVIAVVNDGAVQFYAGSDPVFDAGSIDITRIVDVETGSEFDYTPPRLNPTVRLKIQEGTTTLDVDLEVFTFNGTELHQSTEIDADLAWWKSATSH